MSAPIVVTAAVISRADGAVLLARRGPGRSNAGLWEFPGGKLEPGETPEACLARELREELGVSVVVGGYIASGQALAGGRPIELRGYHARIVAGRLRPAEHDALAWVLPADLPRYPMPPADLPIARALGDDGS